MDAITLLLYMLQIDVQRDRALHWIPSLRLGQVVQSCQTLRGHQWDQSLHVVREDHLYQRDQRGQRGQQCPEKIRLSTSEFLLQFIQGGFVGALVRETRLTNTHSGTGRSDSATSTRETSQTLKHTIQKWDFVLARSTIPKSFKSNACAYI